MKIPTARKLPSGSWFVRVKVDGKEYSVTRPTEKEAVAEAIAIKAGAKQCPNSITLKKAIDKYIEDRENVLSPSTIMGYRTIQRTRFQSVQNIPIAQIKNWQRIINTEAKACSAKTLRNAWMFLASVLKENNLIVERVRLPQIVQKDKRFLDYEQIKEFVALIEGADFEVAALIALHGLRRSELLALTSNSIVNGTIIVKGAVVPDENGNMVTKKTNKNASSARTVPIIIPRLAELLEGVDGQIVTMCPQTIQKHINKTCAKNNLPEVGFHGLRHSFASLCYHLGLSEMQTMELGGWSDSSTMRKIYTHLAQADKKLSVEKLTAFFSP